MWIHDLEMFVNVNIDHAKWAFAPIDALATAKAPPQAVGIANPCRWAPVEESTERPPVTTLTVGGVQSMRRESNNKVES
ncbi:MAG: hypothetical protein KDJ39_10480 [Gammaproteobacteria bacterium]|nr:hypothetical protein [Gammaproteobacteria bacterium]